MKHEDLSAVIVAELKKGRVVETHLESAKGFVMHGICEDGIVFVDPVPTTLETAVHECIHRAFPTWREGRVLREADSFVRAMTPAERRKLFGLYNRVAKKRKGIHKVDVE